METGSRLFVFIVLTLVCATGSNAQEISSLLDHHEKFTANGKIYEDNLYGFPTYHEVGVLNGVAYRIYFLDGSGSFEGAKGNGIDPKVIADRNIDDFKKNWMISCREDAVDILACGIVIPGISVIIDTKGQDFVAIHGDGDPRGAIVEIRLDNALNFVGGKDSRFDGSTANQIIDRLKTAKQVTTNFRRPNNRQNVTRTFDLYGFNEAFTYVKWVVSKCKKVYDSRKGARPDIGGGGFQTCDLR